MNNNVHSTGIILVNLGTPDSPDAPAIRRYLAEFLADPRVVDLPRALWLPILYGFILPFRPKRLVEKYRSIWHGDRGPIIEYTEDLAGKVQQSLEGAQLAANIKVTWAMTYGNPSLADAVDNLKWHGIDDILVLPMFPQYSAATTAAVFDKLASLFGKAPKLPSMRFIAGYHDSPDYIHAVTKSIEPHVQNLGPNARLIFSFHGIPLSQAEAGDPYPDECRETAALIAHNLTLREDQWMLTFQSRFGPAPWLQPYTDETLASLPGQGIDEVIIVCPGFSADCLETLEEIEVENREVFMGAGGRAYSYIPALNATDDHVHMVSELIIKHLYRSESLRN